MPLATQLNTSTPLPKQTMIGIYSPYPQSGKTTVAKFLQQHFYFEHYSFAKPIKQMVHCLLDQAGVEQEMIEQLASETKDVPIPKMGGKSYRELCQTLGTEWGRRIIKESLWRDIALKYRTHRHPIVIDDVRFPEEYAAIKEYGGFMWEIIRNPALPPNHHRSEGLLCGYMFDRVIYNEGSISELYQQLIIKGEF